MRERFIQLGGKPKLPNPYSFTLLECEYHREWFNSGDKIIIDLEDIPDDQVSFTLGDSCALMMHGNVPVVLTKNLLFERIDIQERNMQDNKQDNKHILSLFPEPQVGGITA